MPKLNSAKNNYRPNVSFHPGLPNAVSAHDNHGQLYSDHTPMLLTVPNPLSASQPFKIVTWNVIEIDHFNGFSYNDHLRYGESDSQYLERCERIAQAMARFIKNHNPVFLTLQEMAVDSKILEALYRIEPEFKNIYGEFLHLEGDMVTLYRHDQVERVAAVDDKIKNSISIRGVPALFQMKSNPVYRIKLANTHHRCDVDTRLHEKSITEFLTGQDSTRELHSNQHYTISIVSGDFNGSIASLNAERYNTVSSVVPAGLLADKGIYPLAQENRNHGEHSQGANQIDGGFYSEQHPGQQPEDVHCLQAESVTLNPSTGLAYVFDELPPIDTHTLNPFQADQVAAYRMSITLGQHIQEKHWLSTNETIEQLQARLRDETGDKALCVRLMSNLNNDQTLGFIVNQNAYEYIRSINPHVNAQCFDNFVNCIYVSPETNEYLIRQITLCYLLRKLEALVDNAKGSLPEISAVYTLARDAAKDPTVNPQALVHYTEMADKAIKSPDDKTAISTLISAGQQAEASSNRKLQALGVAMGVLGVALCVLGALILLTSIIPLPHAIPAAVAGGLLITSGLGLFAGGATLAYRSRSADLSAAMVELGNAPCQW